MRLDAEAIRKHLANPGAWAVHVTGEVGSTNDAVLELPAVSSGFGAVLFAESQTAGRGRRGNLWVGHPGDLLFSCVLRDAGPPESWSRLTHVTALALKRTLAEHPGVRPQVKWPNDLYVGGRKLAGILVETRTGAGTPGKVVIGAGMNVNGTRAAMPPEFREVATTLREETGTPVGREILAARVLDHLAQALQLLPDGFAEILQELGESHYLLGRAVRARTGGRSVEGIAESLGGEGELILRTPGGQRLSLTSADEVRLT